jgi:hypothetical protein
VQLCTSSQGKEPFWNVQANEYRYEKKLNGNIIGALELLLDVVTHWSSTYFMLE